MDPKMECRMKINLRMETNPATTTSLEKINPVNPPNPTNGTGTELLLTRTRTTLKIPNLNNEN
jgi:hypothetical protein